MNKQLVLGMLGTAACLCSPASPPAHAHAVLAQKEAPAGGSYRAVVQITHGCKGSPTRAVTVRIPDGAIAARPLVKAGWTVETDRGPYGKTYPGFHGSTISEGVRTIRWTGGTVPADQFDEFTFSVRLTDDFAPGDVVRFPVEQVCETGQHRWVEVPAAGAAEPAEPAPGVRIVAAAMSVAAASPVPTIRAGDLTIERPWIRATPGGAKVAGGYLRVTNTGTVPDRLVGTSIPLAGRGEVHEMSMDGGVMKMRAVDGLPIAPGATVELKPGGFHLMFLDLKTGPKAGEPIKGTLVFERAGTVPVEFEVAPIGAPGPSGGAAGGGHAHHH